MSFMSALVGAAKNAVKRVGETPPDPIDAGDSPYPSSADDGREFRQPPPGIGGKPVDEPSVDAGDSPPVAGADEASAHLNSGGVNPITISRDRALGVDAGVAEDPDAGGEVAGRAGTLKFDNESIEKGMQEAGEKPSSSSDPEEGGESTPGSGLDSGLPEGHVPAGSGLDSGIPEGHVPAGSGLDSGIPEGHVPAGSGLDAGIPEGHVPGGGGAGERGIPEVHIPGGGAGERGIPEGHVPGGEDEDGGIAEDPDGGGAITTVPKGDLALAPGQGTDELEFADSDEPQRRTGTVLLEQDGDSLEEEEGGPFGNPGTSDDEDSTGEGVRIVRLDRTPEGGPDPRDPDRISEALDERLGGRLAAGSVGGLKLEGDYKIEGGALGIASSDPEEGGEIFSAVKFKIEPAHLKFGDLKAEPDFKPEGDLKVEEGIKFEGLPPPSGPGGVPAPYPNVADGGDGLPDALARKAGGEPQEYFKVQMEEVLVSSARAVGEGPEGDELPGESGVEAFMRINKGPGPKTAEVFGSSLSSGEDDDASGGEGAGAADWIERKAGKGQQEYLEVKMQDVLVSSREGEEGLGDIKGESTDDVHKVAFGRRTEVRDSNDRYADLETEEPKPAASLAEDDDDFESSSLLELKPDAAAKATMLPGLAGELLDDIDVELDLDDTPESEL